MGDLPVNPERISRLREFGLSEYAARTYLALLDLGQSEARAISKLSRVPQAKVYQVLDQLHDKGLVEILPEFPKKYQPVAFEEFLDRIHDQHQAAASAIARTRDELTALFAMTGTVDVGDRGDVTVLRGRHIVAAKMADLAQAAQKSLFFVGTPGLSERPAVAIALAKAARARGVQVRALMPVEPNGAHQLSALESWAEVRVRSTEEGELGDTVAILLVDDEQLLLVQYVPDDGGAGQGHDVGITTDQPAMVGAIRSMMRVLWNRAPRISETRDVSAPADGLSRVIETRAHVGASFVEALTHHEGEVLVAHASPLEITEEEFRAFGQHPVRILIASGDDTSQVREHIPPHWEARVDPRPRFARGAILGDREAFISIGAPLTDHGDEYVIHTRDSSVVRVLRAQFEAAWATGLPLGATHTAAPRHVPVEGPSRQVAPDS